MPTPSTCVAAAVLCAWTAATVTQANGFLNGAADDFPAPPARLGDTGLYAPGLGGSAGMIDPANRAFAPQYPLWTDGATKRRWVFLPAGAVIDGSDETSWVLPVGTKFWKEFSFDGRRIETRMSWRATPTRWVFAAYHWNDAGTEATLADRDGVPGVVEVAPGRRHSIPSVNDCLACHGATKQTPLGFNALQLSTDRDASAIHAEPLSSGMATLETLLNDRHLIGSRSDIIARPPRIRTDSAETRTLLGYLFANCGGCHNGQGEIAALGPVLKLGDLLSNGDAVARQLVGQRTSWSIPGLPRGGSVLVAPGAPDASALLVRMRSRRPSSQMPPLGTVVRDDDAVAAVEDWIRTMAPSH